MFFAGHHINSIRSSVTCAGERRDRKYTAAQCDRGREAVTHQQAVSETTRKSDCAANCEPDQGPISSADSNRIAELDTNNIAHGQSKQCSNFIAFYGTYERSK